jgi:hypothetical protein
MYGFTIIVLLQTGLTLNIAQVNFLVVSLMFVFACVVSIWRISIVLWLFVLNFMTQGFVSGALINVPLNDKLGFGRVSFKMFSVDDTTSDNVSGSLSRLSQLVRSTDRQLAHNPLSILGALCQVIGYAIQVPGPPFPAFVFAFVINGVGIALQVGGRYFYFQPPHTWAFRTRKPMVL